MSITLVRNLDWAVATSEVMKAKSFMASNGSFEYGSGLIECRLFSVRNSVYPSGADPGGLGRTDHGGFLSAQIRHYVVLIYDWSSRSPHPCF